jgi:hypothetical protein
MSQVAEAWIHLDGRRFSLADWPMHRTFYNERYRRTLFKTGRQVAKSTTLANFSIIECAIIPHFKTLFISPSKEQTVRFSNSRVAKVMNYSPIINKTFLKSDLVARVLHKQYTNGSEMLFTYASDDPDRLRGPSSDRNLWDEVQDILHDPVILVGNETLNQSRYHYETYAGTPKTMENTIQYFWEGSSQTEWVMKCSGCNSWQFIETDKSIGKRGIICLKCGKYLNPYTGRWIDMNSFANSDIPERERMKGFHVNQLMMPTSNPYVMEQLGRSSLDIEFAKDQWDTILRKHVTYPPSTFRNEILGISDAIGTRMLSKEELETLCDPNMHLYPTMHASVSGYTFCTAGVDWSGGGTKGVSRTVLWVWGFHPGKQKLICLYYKIFPGTNPVNGIDEIAIVCDAFKVQMVVGDAGEGHTANDLLRKKLGYSRVQQLQYGASPHAIKWNGVDRYLTDKTTLIDNYFLMLKRQGAIFATVREMEMANTEILNEYEDITPAGKRVWRHSPQKPDDCLHAGLYGWVAMKMVQNDLKFYQ